MSAVVMTTLLALAASGGDAPILVGYVDVGMAIQKSNSGRKLASELKSETARAAAKVRRLEDGLFAKKKRISKAAYEKEAAAIEKMRANAEARLEALQEKKLAPIVASLKARIGAHNAATRAERWATLDEVAVLLPAAACDRTDVATLWLDGVKAELVALPPSCAVKRVAKVEVLRAFFLSKVGKRAGAELDAKKAKGQKELDARRRQLREVQAAADKSRRRDHREEAQALAQVLASRFSALERSLADAERRSEARLFDELIRVLQAAARARPRLLFVEAPSDALGLAECDATEVAAAMLDGVASAQRNLDVTCP